jgi:conjugative relaxase-like TrwC/TraI family protein
VSVLFAIGEPEVVREIIGGHEAAVAEAVGYLDREACRARRGHGGASIVEGRGFVAAAFPHRSSRAGDPLLHTHVVIANATQGPDGRWTALDGRLLYRHSKTAGYVDQAALRAELQERLGLRWHAVERGTADAVGVPRRVIEHFSRRRAEILEHMAARGERSARAAQVATLETAAARTTASRYTDCARSGELAPPSTASATGSSVACSVASWIGRCATTLARSPSNSKVHTA